MPYIIHISKKNQFSKSDFDFFSSWNFFKIYETKEKIIYEIFFNYY